MIQSCGAARSVPSSVDTSNSLPVHRASPPQNFSISAKFSCANWIASMTTGFLRNIGISLSSACGSFETVRLCGPIRDRAHQAQRLAGCAPIQPCADLGSGGNEQREQEAAE